MGYEALPMLFGLVGGAIGAQPGRRWTGLAVAAGYFVASMVFIALFDPALETPQPTLFLSFFFGLIGMVLVAGPLGIGTGRATKIFIGAFLASLIGAFLIANQIS